VLLYSDAAEFWVFYVRVFLALGLRPLLHTTTVREFVWSFAPWQPTYRALFEQIDAAV
jgi:hypothetical protein